MESANEQVMDEGMIHCSCQKKYREREREKMDVTQLVRLPNEDQVVMGSNPTFHNGIK